MQKRITITYTCNHDGPKLEPVIMKYWDTCPPPGAVCYCLRDGEKVGGYKPTAMVFAVNIEESKPE